jgi:hypothetical protein
MQILTFRGEVHTSQVVGAEFHAVGSLIVIAQRLEMEGAKILSRSSDYISFRGGSRARFIASKWSFLLAVSSGDVNVFAKDEKVVVSYKICFDELALVLLFLFIFIGLIFIYSFAKGTANISYLPNVYCLVPIFMLAVSYFGISSVFAIIRFQRLLRSCLKETNLI